MSKADLCITFDFPSFKQVTEKHKKQFSKQKTVDKWMYISRGLNLSGICKNKKCEAFNKKGWASLGLGQFHFPYTLHHIPCVVCTKNLKKIQCVGLWGAKLIGKGKKVVQGNQTDDEDSIHDQEDQDQSKFQYISDQQDSFLIFGQIAKQIIQWHYLILKVHTYQIKKKKPQIILSVPKQHKCPQNHPLTSLSNEGITWTCNECFKNYKAEQIGKSCRQCHYNICQQCCSKKN